MYARGRADHVKALSIDRGLTYLSRLASYEHIRRRLRKSANELRDQDRFPIGLYSARCTVFVFFCVSLDLDLACSRSHDCSFREAIYLSFLKTGRICRPRSPYDFESAFSKIRRPRQMRLKKAKQTLLLCRPIFCFQKALFRSLYFAKTPFYS